MKKMILKVTNYAAYLAGCYGVGYLLGKIVEKLFGDFLSDEAYAEQHPWKFLLAVLGILICEFAIGAAIVLWPLLKRFTIISMTRLRLLTRAKTRNGTKL